MRSIHLVIYNTVIRFYTLGIFIVSFFNSKAKLWIDGRKSWKAGAEKLSTYKGKRIWFHCASLGEFEQARPVIERYKSENSSDAIIVTFFSPSGYEVRKNYPSADFITYLPVDTARNAKDFLDFIKPDVALFVKYEFWYHYLHHLKQRNIPIILFSAVFRKEQIFFKPYGSFFREILTCFTTIFVQSEESKKLLESVNIACEVASDTRFDRVAKIAGERKSFPAIEKFKEGFKIFIAGSTWKKDEELILKCIHDDVLKEYKYIIAPHDIDSGRVEELRKKIKVRARRLSMLTVENASETDVVIVDSIGQLASLYYYGDIAYVGGGFNASVHNVLEPAVYGMPFLFGPNYKKSLEAIALKNDFAAFPVEDYSELLYELNTLTTGDGRRFALAGLRAKQYVKSNLGGSERVSEELQKLTNG